ncbi:MAG: GNAT family N-acetyltransferase [Lachnospiraceae bacterium]|nr:GNAT family N-acetyltransferase [Lachnospiraceae bacterium]
MELVSYDPKYRQKFIELNTAWIKNNFGFLEDEDIKTFQKIEKEIAKGAMIFFALENSIVLAACMTRPISKDTWEICKLATDEQYRRQGAGSKLFKKCMEYAIENNAKRLFIISNSKLKPALHIYQKYGFIEIKLDDYEYSRGDIAFEYIVES